MFCRGSFEDWSVAVAEAQCSLERFGETLFDIGRRTEAIDHRFDGVFLTQRQRRHRVEFVLDAVPPLVEKLKDPSKEQRRLAVRAVGQIGPGAAETIPLLRAFLLDPESGRQDAAAGALASMGKPAIPVLVEAMKGDDGPMLRQVMTGLGSFWAMAAFWHDPAVIECAGAW